VIEETLSSEDSKERLLADLEKKNNDFIGTLNKQLQDSTMKGIQYTNEMQDVATKKLYKKEEKRRKKEKKAKKDKRRRKETAYSQMVRVARG
jgi:hypothetical protein